MANYMEILKTCTKCGKPYSGRTRSAKCPHNFKDELSRRLVGQENLNHSSKNTGVKK